MKLVIAGSRNLELNICFLNEMLDNFNLYPEEIVCGCARGIDYLGEKYSEYNGLKLAEFPANWEEHGKAAGPIRNREMAKYGDALLLIWDGKSSGSQNMKEEMKKQNKPIYEIIIKQPKGDI